MKTILLIIKNAVQLIFFIVVLGVVSGCMIKEYLRDRGDDVKDIFTISAGYGVGAEARVGPISTGLYAGVSSVGLRGGEWLDGHIPHLDDQSVLSRIPNSADVTGILWSYEELTDPKLAQRNKAYIAKTVFPFVQHAPSLSYYTQIDVSGGLLGALKLGFNPGELLDFILGWAMIDIYRDDLERENIIASKIPPSPSAPE